MSETTKTVGHQNKTDLFVFGIIHRLTTNRLVCGNVRLQNTQNKLACFVSLMGCRVRAWVFGMPNKSKKQPLHKNAHTNIRVRIATAYCAILSDFNLLFIPFVLGRNVIRNQLWNYVHWRHRKLECALLPWYVLRAVWSSDVLHDHIGPGLCVLFFFIHSFRRMLYVPIFTCLLHVDSVKRVWNVQNIYEKIDWFSSRFNSPCTAFLRLEWPCLFFVCRCNHKFKGIKACKFIPCFELVLI